MRDYTVPLYLVQGIEGQESSNMVIDIKTERRWQPVVEWMKDHPEAGSKNFVYAAIREGTYLSLRAGGKRLIASDALDVLAERQAQERQEAAANGN